jgi:riboflavin kinase/FMN adenylyltransferase
VVTVGSFDGVHVGHRVILSRLNTLASAAGGESVLITFYPHPRKVLYPETTGKMLSMISTREEKLLLLEETGLDHLIILHFTRDFARVTSEEFVREYLVGKLHAHTIVVGFNHHFGYNQEGNYEYLYRVRERYHFQVEEIPEQEIQHETVSSTKIRKALKEGNIQRANAYLEHHFLILAELNKDTDSLKKYRQPALRLIIKDSEKLIPPPGLYAVRCHGQEWKGVVLAEDGQLLLFPADNNAVPVPGIQKIRFYKRLDRNGELSLIHGLEAARELIY